MAQVATGFVRAEMTPARAAPISTSGAAAWMRENLFPNWWSAVLTIVGILIAASVLSAFIKFAVFDAVWIGEGRQDCLAADGTPLGACWAYVGAKFYQFLYGFYPSANVWRVNLAFVLFIAGLIPIAMPDLPGKLWNSIYLLAIFPVVAFVLLSGGVFGLEPVETTLWGGLLVTLVVSVTGIVTSLPLGVLLALGRRSSMPAVRFICILFIEFWRGVPLITVLFMASVMLPLFLPEGVHFDKLLRALVGVTLFASAYMAEVVRGGLQAIPKGQYEGAAALGLGYWRMMGLVVMPQALKLVIPGIVNTFIGLFKDTTLVMIIGLFDLLGSVQLSMSDPNWSVPQQAATGYLFAGFIFWACCFAMSRYSMSVEKRLNAGQRH